MKFEELLHQSGAQLVRWKNHQVYRLPNGTKYVMPSTPSDHRTLQNQIRDLRRACAQDAARGGSVPTAEVIMDEPMPIESLQVIAKIDHGESEPPDFNGAMDTAVESIVERSPVEESMDAHLKNMEQWSTRQMTEMGERISFLNERIASDTAEIEMLQGRMRAAKDFVESLALTMAYYKEVQPLLGEPDLNHTPDKVDGTDNPPETIEPSDSIEATEDEPKDHRWNSSHYHPTKADKAKMLTLIMQMVHRKPLQAAEVKRALEKKMPQLKQARSTYVHDFLRRQRSLRIEKRGFYSFVHLASD